jgi:small subunit ribosomal protein S3
LGVIKTWRSRWYAGRNYADMLHEDLRLRRYIKERLFHSGVSRIEIERKADQIRIIIHTARPGIIIGKKGSEVEKLRAELGKDEEGSAAGSKRSASETDAQLVAEQIAQQLERRGLRRAMKKRQSMAMRLGAQGSRSRRRAAGGRRDRQVGVVPRGVCLCTRPGDIDFGLTTTTT